LIMDRFYSIFVDSDDDSSQCWLRKNQQRKCIKDAISSHCPYFATSLLRYNPADADIFNCRC
ncbi:MAG: hypothetical protein ABIJ03_00890, partial [Patescibacteria group bacterium]